MDFGARTYDSRVAKWLSIDPEFKIYPFNSPYISFGNNPIYLKDVGGEKIYIYYDSGKKDADGKPILSSYEYGSGLKLPNDRSVRQTVRALNKIQRRGKDPNGIIKTLANSETANAAIVKRESWDKVTMSIGAVGGTMKTEGGETKNLDGTEAPDLIFWHPRQGFISLDGKTRQSAANSLLHELGHTYYDHIDPEGHMAEFMAILGIKDETERANAFAEYDKKQAAAVGEFDTYSDKWIIEKVESNFGEGQRSDHRGAFLKTIGSAFSKIGFKFAKNGKQGKTRDLKKD